MTLCGALILPHGTLLLDHVTKSTTKKLKLLRNAVDNAVERAKSWKPDVVVIITPHGISLDEQFGIILNSKVKGTAEWIGKYSDFVVEQDCDLTLPAKILAMSREDGIPISGITCMHSEYQAPIAWGEVVPLWFLKEFVKKCIILTLPTKRLIDPKGLVDISLSFGKTLNKVFKECHKRVLFVVSGDLAHTHSAAGPYGVSDAAVPFDSVTAHWCETMDKESLLQDMLELLDDAKACGYLGFVVLQGLLANAIAKPIVHGVTAPTYYGMLVGSFAI